MQAFYIGPSIYLSAASACVRPCQTSGNQLLATGHTSWRV